MAQGVSATKHRRVIVKKVSYLNPLVQHLHQILLSYLAADRISDRVSFQESTVKKGEYVDHSVLWTLDNSVKGWDSVTLQLYASGKTATAGSGKSFSPCLPHVRGIPVADPASGAERVGDLKINLKGVNWGEVPRTTAPDNRSLLYQFDATLRMGIAGDSGLRTFKLLRNGQEIGTVAFKAQ